MKSLFVALWILSSMPYPTQAQPPAPAAQCTKQCASSTPKWAVKCKKHKTVRACTKHFFQAAKKCSMRNVSTAKQCLIVYISCLKHTGMKRVEPQCLGAHKACTARHTKAYQACVTLHAKRFGACMSRRKRAYNDCIARHSKECVVRCQKK